MNVKINPAQRIVIEFEGEEYPCTKPTIGAVMDLEEALEVAKTSGTGGTKVLMAHLVSCGLPEDVIRRLDPDQIEAVSVALSPAKKN